MKSFKSRHSKLFKFFKKNTYSLSKIKKKLKNCFFNVNYKFII